MRDNAVLEPWNIGAFAGYSARMKASTRIHDKLGYIVTTVEGSVTLPELGAHIQSVWADPAWKSDYNGILDFSAATIDLSDGELQNLTKGMQQDPRCSFGKWAFVVSTAAAFAKLRNVDHAADLRSSIRIFFDLRAAEGWLLARGAAPQHR
jgi:hypothetical protein